MAKKVLLIDSDASLVGTLTGTLESHGFEVFKTADGKEGIELARQHAPDLVVLCVELPKASGYSICSKLKKDDALRSIPIVLTSAEASQKTFEDHKKLKIGRADEYLLKPFQAAALIDKVKSLIGLPEVQSGDDDALDISGLAEEISVTGEEPVMVEEVEELPVEPDSHAPTAANLPGDEDLAMLDAAFENLEEKREAPKHAAANGHDDHLELESASAEIEQVASLEPDEPLVTPARADEHADELLSKVERTAPAAPASAPAGNREELERLRSGIASLKQQLEAVPVDAKPSGGKDKEYFAVKEKLAQREKELLKLREELNGKEKELLEVHEHETALEQEVSAKDQELGKRDGQIKTLQQKVDALVAGQKRSERDLSTTREEARQAAARLQASEQELATVRAAATEHEATALRVGKELSASQKQNQDLETSVQSEHARNDELSAELHGTRTQLEETQGIAEELRRKVAELEDAAGKSEDRVVKAYQKIKGDEKLKDKVRKALGIALELLDEQGADIEELEERP